MGSILAPTYDKTRICYVLFNLLSFCRLSSTYIAGSGRIAPFSNSENRIVLWAERPPKDCFNGLYNHEWRPRGIFKNTFIGKTKNNCLMISHCGPSWFAKSEFCSWIQSGVLLRWTFETYHVSGARHFEWHRIDLLRLCNIDDCSTITKEH